MFGGYGVLPDGRLCNVCGHSLSQAEGAIGAEQVTFYRSQEVTVVRMGDRKEYCNRLVPIVRDDQMADVKKRTLPPSRPKVCGCLRFTSRQATTLPCGSQVSTGRKSAPAHARIERSIDRWSVVSGTRSLPTRIAQCTRRADHVFRPMAIGGL